jgi:uncharacterized protein (DUF1810 family)
MFQLCAANPGNSLTTYREVVQQLHGHPITYLIPENLINEKCITISLMFLLNLAEYFGPNLLHHKQIASQVTYILRSANKSSISRISNYRSALAEITAEQKRSHWMWYIFPQYDGLGFSSTSRHYAIKSPAEAAAYLEHPVLGPRLRECVNALLSVTDRTAHEVFGSPDDLKLKSSMTLFTQVSPEGSVFEQVLDGYFGGERDGKTLELLRGGR